MNEQIVAKKKKKKGAVLEFRCEKCNEMRS